MAAARLKAGHRLVYVEAPVELAERLKVVAKRNRRSVTNEAVVAFERHVTAESTSSPGGSSKKK